ncbi:MAG TPA: gluconeogenesis factor YvcK family protein [Candidatus Saccharimonadales bacterium]|nr:gluconeogenesis factor YvcK family protein [Candidatus Saccharimonadales bacterium]
MAFTEDSRIVVIGGGTGSFMLLEALKPKFKNLTALVTMADDGGSTGVLRDELGVLPPGDVRQCLVALARSPKVRDLFNYRFEEGMLAGHSFGNLFLTALEKLTGSFAEAVETASEVLDAQGRVIPITLDNVRLMLEVSDEFRVRGEHNIDTLRFNGSGSKPRLTLEPRAAINPDALAAIAAADMVIFAPGDLYTSLGPLLTVDGVADALQKSKAHKVYICNLVVKPGQTDGFDVADHAAEIERFAGGPVLDTVIYNTAEPAGGLPETYVREGEYLVEVDAQNLKAVHYRAIGKPLLSTKTVAISEGDPLAAQRSLIRHDGAALLGALLELR